MAKPIQLTSLDYEGAGAGAPTSGTVAGGRRPGRKTLLGYVADSTTLQLFACTAFVVGLVWIVWWATAPLANL
jgi:hypothetical protein